MRNALERIANALEEIIENGITVKIKYPDDMDKFVTDLPAMKVADAINGLSDLLKEKHNE